MFVVDGYKFLKGEYQYCDLRKEHSYTLKLENPADDTEVTYGLGKKLNSALKKRGRKFHLKMADQWTYTNDYIEFLWYSDETVTQADVEAWMAEEGSGFSDADSKGETPKKKRAPKVVEPGSDADMYGYFMFVEDGATCAKRVRQNISALVKAQFGKYHPEYFNAWQADDFLPEYVHVEFDMNKVTYEQMHEIVDAYGTKVSAGISIETQDLSEFRKDDDPQWIADHVCGIGWNMSKEDFFERFANKE